MISGLNTTIELLAPAIAERIAAGEVIERPGSVLKELVENALDAGAGRISVDIEDAGFALMRIADDGAGMSPDNLERCILRHATSKIRSLEDLDGLHTMGFRGEALASVVAVSRTEILACADQSGLGSRLCIEGGTVSPITPSARSRGTTITVRDLFYNTPARKKFMKSRKSERMYLMRLMEQIATPFPSVHFSLSLDTRIVFETSPARNLRERISQFAGTEFASRLIECSCDISTGASATVFISPPSHPESRPRFSDLYVNLRRVDCDAVTFAVRNACSPHFPPSTKPSFFAFIDIDPSRIDVNVHPTKAKIKFEDERGVAGAVYRAVERSLALLLSPDSQPLSPSKSDNSPVGISLGAQHRSYQTQWSPAQSSHPDSAQQTIAFPSILSAPVVQERFDSHEAKTRDDTQPGNWDLISCHQIHNLFILAPIKNGILLIDQHAAHERVLYEQALDDLNGQPATSQQLLFPTIIELSTTEKSVVMASLESFTRLGYEITDFGGTALAVSAMPAFIAAGAVERAVRDMVEFLLDESSMRHFPQPSTRFAAAFACGCAIKQGQELTREEMSALLNSLFAARDPYTCPHGRPTVTRFSLEELKRRFMR